MDRPIFYILAGHEPVPVTDTELYGRWFEDSSNHLVQRTELAGGIYVSTIFVGIDTGGHDEGPPILFETMVIGGTMDGTRSRYSTWKDAELGHALILTQLIHEQ